MAGLFFSSGVDKGFEDDLKRMNDQMNNLSDNVQAQGAKMDSTFKMLGGAVAGFFSFQAIKGFANEVLNVRGEFENLEIALEVMLQSKPKADKLIAEIAELAAKTPFSLSEVSQGAKQLIAFGEGADTVIGTLSKLGDIAAGTSSDVSGLVAIYGKVMVKGKISSLELNSLAARGIPIYSELAKVMNVSQAEVSKLVETGEIGFPEIQQVVKNLTGETGIFFNLMESQSKSVQGLLSNLGDQFDQIYNDIGKANEGFIKGSIEGISVLAENWEILVNILKVLVVTYGTYKVALMATIAWQKALEASQVQAALAGRTLSAGEVLHTAILYKVNAAQALFNRTIGKNPYVFAATAIIGIVTALALFVKGTDEANEGQERLDNAMSDVNDKVGKQAAEIKQLQSVAKDQAASDKTRLDAIKKLTDIMPDYNAELSKEGELINENTAAIEGYLKQLELKTKLGAVHKELTGLWESEVAQIKIADKAQEAYNKSVISFRETTKPGSSASWREQQGAEAWMKSALIDSRAAEKELKKTRDAIEMLRLEYNSADKDLSDFFKTQNAGTAEELISIDFLKKELSNLIAAREKATKISDTTGLAILADEILAKEKQIDSFRIKQSESGNAGALQSLEIQNQARINAIKESLGFEKTQRGLMDSKLLEAQLDYLNKKEKLTLDSFEKLQLREQIIQVEIEIQSGTVDKDLNDLLLKFSTFTEKREALEKKHIQDVNRLQQEGYWQKAEIAMELHEKDMEALETSFLNENRAYSEWLEDELPEVIKKGSKAVLKELEFLKKALSLLDIGSDESAVVAGKIKAMELALKEINKTTKSATMTTADYIQVIGDVNDILKDTISAFGDMDAFTAEIVGGLSDTVSGLVGMATAIEGVGDAATTMEKVSLILVAISAAFKVFGAIGKMISAVQQDRLDKQYKELSNINTMNKALIEQNKLYEIGNSYFADDKWGTALHGLQAYNDTIIETNRALREMQSMESGWDFSIWVSSQRGADNVDYIKQNALNYKSDLEKALAGITIKTKDYNGFMEAFGKVDQFDSLLKLYPGVIDAQGRLNTSVLEGIMERENLSNLDKERLQNLIELTNLAEESVSQFGSYISSIFGTVGDEITRAFQQMYEGGSDAMESLEVSFSRMIESFTRDAIEFAFLSPILGQLNSMTKDLGEQYARGDISVDELQNSIISTLGDFYTSLNDIQPAILEAYNNADRLAEQAGFESAFDGSGVLDPNQSRAGQIQQAITEETGSELVGRLGAMMLSNERIANYSQEIYEVAVLNLVSLNLIKENTDFLPIIADNTRRTFESLQNT